MSYVASAVGIWANLGNGRGNYGDAEGDTYVSIERVIGSEFDDQLSDVLGNANGYLEGRGGNDYLAGREGMDTMLGGAGNDVIYATDGDIIDGGADYDTVMAEATTVAAGFHFKVAGTNVEYTLGNAGNDVIDATGVSTKVSISGMGGNNTLTGGSAGDRIDAGNGMDLITGGAGDDLVTGAAMPTRSPSRRPGATTASPTSRSAWTRSTSPSRG